MTQEQNKPYWNIFAQELQTVLRKHNMELGLLDDRFEIHRETIRRLKHSLHNPSRLPVLNPEDLDTVINQLQLDSEDVTRLHASVLAIGVQRMLSDRISEDDARLAAEQVLPIMIQSLSKHTGVRGLGNTRPGDIDPEDDDELSNLLEFALDAIDRGANALSQSESAWSHAERVNQARQAIRYYTDAIEELDRASRSVRKIPGWQSWHSAAQKYLALARARLRKLGEI